LSHWAKRVNQFPRLGERGLLLARGLEPPRVSPYGPEPYASANSATRAAAAALKWPWTMRTASQTDALTTRRGERRRFWITPNAACVHELLIGALCVPAQSNATGRRS